VGGAGVGCDVGRAVGCGVGRCVGCGVGSGVGSGVGRGVGARVGSGVGGRLGAVLSVGEVVGVFRKPPSLVQKSAAPHRSPTEDTKTPFGSTSAHPSPAAQEPAPPRSAPTVAFRRKQPEGRQAQEKRSAPLQAPSPT